MNHARIRQTLTILWLAGAATALYLYFFQRDSLEDLLNSTTSASFAAGCAVYLIFGCLRGFTLIPATSLVLLGVVFFRPWPLFWLTLAGILVSSVSVYYFAEAMHVDEVLQRKHAHRMAWVQSRLQRYGLPIIIGWAFFPVLPTDLICYLAGVVRLPLRKVLLGVAIGEGTICAIYIFLGDSLLRIVGLR